MTEGLFMIVMGLLALWAIKWRLPRQMDAARESAAARGNRARFDTVLASWPYRLVVTGGLVAAATLVIGGVIVAAGLA